jgi:hypothetical protein
MLQQRSTAFQTARRWTRQEHDFVQARGQTCSKRDKVCTYPYLLVYLTRKLRNRFSGIRIACLEDHVTVNIRPHSDPMLISDDLDCSHSVSWFFLSDPIPIHSRCRADQVSIPFRIHSRHPRGGNDQRERSRAAAKRRGLSRPSPDQ